MANVEALGPLISANPGWLVALAPPALVAYFAPFLIAFERQHRFLWTIAAINFATGWTLLGWIATLVWAVNKDVKSLVDELPTPEPDSLLEPQWTNPTHSDGPPVAGHFKRCPYCAEHIRAEAIVCRFCTRELTPGAEIRTATDLDDRERRRLESLLTDNATGAPQDPRLLDIFDYARLLEAEESAAILARVGVANLPIQGVASRETGQPDMQQPQPAKDQIDSAAEDSDSDWMLNAPMAGRAR